MSKINQTSTNEAGINAGDIDGFAPIHWAAINGYIPKIKSLLANKADIEDTDNIGMTPLLLATYFDKLDAVQFLLEQKATINHRNIMDENALQIAANNKNLETFNIINYYNDKHLQTWKKTTEAQHAAIVGQKTEIELLKQILAVPQKQALKNLQQTIIDQKKEIETLKQKTAPKQDFENERLKKICEEQNTALEFLKQNVVDSQERDEKWKKICDRQHALNEAQKTEIKLLKQKADPKKQELEKLQQTIGNQHEVIKGQKIEIEQKKLEIAFLREVTGCQMLDQNDLNAMRVLAEVIVSNTEDHKDDSKVAGDIDPGNKFS